MPDRTGIWDPTPLGVLAAVAEGIQAAGPNYRAGLVVVLGSEALRTLRPEDAEDSDIAIEAELMVLEGLFVGMESVMLGHSRDPGHSDRLYVVCTGEAGKTHTSSFRLHSVF